MTRTRGERGASIVEFALVLPVIMTFLLGIITSGAAYSHKLNLSHAAREAARYGATIPDNQSGTGAGFAWAQTIANDAISLAGGDLSASGATYCVALVTGTNTVYSDPSNTGTYYYYSNGVTSTSYPVPGSAPSTCFNDGGTDGARRVQVKVTYPGSIQTAVFSQSITLTGQTEARFEY
jgi:Flp pilus assembly protein TadG